MAKKSLVDRIVDYVVAHAKKGVDRGELRSMLEYPVEELEDEYGKNFLSDEEIAALFSEGSDWDEVTDKYPELCCIMVDVIVDIECDYLEDNDEPDDDDDDDDDDEQEEDKYHFDEHDDEPL